MIEVEGLTRRYGDVLAVDHLTFEIPQGAISGFLGPNGAGKTTTMRILATLEQPTSGSARVAGHDVLADPLKVRKLLGYMPDETGTTDHLLVSEYIDFFARARGLYGKDRRRQVQRITHFTGLTRLLDRPVAGLSKGERQRLSLTRAMLGEPKVLMLDEPAAGLDPGARVELREVLKALADRGVTVLISSHVLGELSDLVDHVVVIRRGALVYEGELEALLSTTTGGRYRLEAASDPVELQRFLMVQPEVESVSAEGKVLLLRTEDSTVPELLARAMAEGHRLQQFQRASGALEAAFLALTAEEDT